MTSTRAVHPVRRSSAAYGSSRRAGALTSRSSSRATPPIHTARETPPFSTTPKRTSSGGTPVRSCPSNPPRPGCTLMAHSSRREVSPWFTRAVVVDNHEERRGARQIRVGTDAPPPPRFDASVPTAVSTGTGRGPGARPPGPRAAAARMHGPRGDATLTRSAGRRSDQRCAGVRGARAPLRCRVLATPVSACRMPPRPDPPRARAQKPRRPSCLGSRCQSLATLTCRSRYTRWPSSASMPARAFVPTSRSRDPPRPMTIAFWRVALDEHVDPHVEQRLALAAALARARSPRRPPRGCAAARRARPRAPPRAPARRS